MMSEVLDDVLWSSILNEASAAAEAEPLLAHFLHRTIQCHASLEDALAFHLASKLASPAMEAAVLLDVFQHGLASDPAIGQAVRADIRAYYKRDPACNYYSMPLLYFKGFHAIQCHRITHWLWSVGRCELAAFLQSRVAEVMGADIHPAACIGYGVMLDHGTGTVVGETARIGNNVSILHAVTLGGSGKQRGDRHPKVEDGVMIGAGATILGNICIGECAKVGAGSVVLDDVPAHCTVAGVPARLIGQHTSKTPALDMDQRV